MCLKVLEKPIRSYFLSLGMLKIFPYEWMILASSLYAISAWERFHRNAVLSENRETCLIERELPSHSWLLYSAYRGVAKYVYWCGLKENTTFCKFVCQPHNMSSPSWEHKWSFSWLFYCSVKMAASIYKEWCQTNLWICEINTIFFVTNIPGWNTILWGFHDDGISIL